MSWRKTTGPIETKLIAGGKTSSVWSWVKGSIRKVERILAVHVNLLGSPSLRNRDHNI